MTDGVAIKRGWKNIPATQMGVTTRQLNKRSLRDPFRFSSFRILLKIMRNQELENSMLLPHIVLEVQLFEVQEAEQRFNARL